MKTLYDEINFIGNIGNRSDINEWRERILAHAHNFDLLIAAAKLCRENSAFDSTDGNMRVEGASFDALMKALKVIA